MEDWSTHATKTRKDIATKLHFALAVHAGKERMGLNLRAKQFPAGVASPHSLEFERSYNKRCQGNRSCLKLEIVRAQGLMEQ